MGKVKGTAYKIAEVMIFIYMVLLMMICTEAKVTGVNVDAPAGITDIHETSSGEMYIVINGKVRTGWIRFRGKTYYAHTTASQMYLKGELCRNTYRVRKGKMYYFGDDGAMVTKEMKYVSFNKDGSVKEIYPSGRMIRRYRYNANRRRYQWLNDSGKWTDVGMQCWPEGSIDWQA